MLSPDAIADAALIQTSVWQREALPTSDEAMLMLWKFQAERAEKQDNRSDQDWHHEILRKATRTDEVSV